MGKPTKRKSPEAEGNTNLYTAIGQAITHWSDLEGRLVRIAAQLLGAPTTKTGLVFYSILSFRAWITIIDELFKLNKESYPKSHALWRKREIVDRLTKAQDTRDRIAHHGAATDKPDELRPHKFDVRLKYRKSKLTTTDITAFVDQADGLYDDLVKILIVMKRPPPSR